MSTYLDDLADQMILPACRLVAAVQDRQRDEVTAIVEPLSAMELRALVVVLAELVPADDVATSLFTTWKLQDERAPLPPVTAEEAAENRRELVAEVAAYKKSKRSAA